MSDRIARAFNRCGATSAVAHDIYKAFDRVWHTVLLHKLKCFGIPGQIFGLISFFLSNRQLRVVLGGKASEEYPVNAGVPQWSILGPALFALYINDLPDDAICNIAIYADDITLYSKLMRHLICGSNQNWLLNLNLIYKTLWNGAGSGLLISILLKLNWFHLTGLITGTFDVKMDQSVLEERSSFKKLKLTFSSKLDRGSYIISIAKTPLICSMKFVLYEVALYLNKSTIQPCMEYCCHVLAGALS